MSKSSTVRTTVRGRSTRKKDHLTGNNLNVCQNYAHIVGNNARVVGSYCDIEGNNANVVGSYCTVTGNNANCTGDYNKIYGNNGESTGNYCKTFGNNNKNTGTGCKSFDSAGNLTNRSTVPKSSNSNYFETVITDRNGNITRNICVGGGGGGGLVMDGYGNVYASGVSISNGRINCSGSGRGVVIDENGNVFSSGSNASSVVISSGVQGLGSSVRNLVQRFTGKRGRDDSSSSDSEPEKHKRKRKKEAKPRLPAAFDDQPEAKEGETTCTICEERGVNTVIKSCNHSVLCVTCARKYGEDTLNTCPVCRKEIKRIERIYN